MSYTTGKGEAMSYTVIRSDGNEGVEVTHFDSGADLNDFISQIVEEYDLDYREPDFNVLLSEMVVVFEGRLEPKKLKFHMVSRLDVE